VETDRRGFLSLLGIGAAVTVLPTQLTQAIKPKMLQTEFPKRRFARALSGLVNVRKFKMYIHDGEDNTFLVSGTMSVIESDGFCGIKFADWVADRTMLVRKISIVDDEGYVIHSTIPRGITSLCIGDKFILHYEINT
jgi:hypothetical protein